MKDTHRVLRIAEKMVAGFQFVRGEVIPDGVKINTIDNQGTNLEIVTWDSDGIQYGMAFDGKSSKPLWRYRFRNEYERERRIAVTIEDAKDRMIRKNQRVEQRRTERSQFQHSLKMGDILVTSWGYDQTNIDYFQVTAVGEKSVKIRELNKKLVGQSGQDDVVMPATNSFKGPEMLKIVGLNNSVKVYSFAWAHLWDGKPDEETNSAYGH